MIQIIILDRNILVRTRARIFHFLRSPRIASKESIPPGYVAWRAGTTTPIPNRFLVPIDCLKIPAPDSGPDPTLFSSGFQDAKPSCKVCFRIFMFQNFFAYD